LNGSKIVKCKECKETVKFLLAHPAIDVTSDWLTVLESTLGGPPNPDNSCVLPAGSDGTSRTISLPHFGQNGTSTSVSVITNKCIK